MNIRSYCPSDLKLVKMIHERHFKEEFDLPNFFKQFHMAFVLESQDEGPVVIGGVRPIAELVAVTNKDASARARVIALKSLVEASKFVCNEFNYDQLHCFVQGDDWSRQVQTVHFRPTKGQSLVLDVG